MLWCMPYNYHASNGGLIMTSQNDQPKSVEEQRARIPPKAPLSQSWHLGETVADEFMIIAAFKELEQIKGKSLVRKLIDRVERQVSTLEEKLTTHDDELFQRFKRKAEKFTRTEVKKGFCSRISQYREYIGQ